MTHINHNTINIEILLIIRYDIANIIPQRTNPVLVLFEFLLVHSNCIISNVIEIRMTVQAQISNIRPSRLNIIGGPISKGTGDSAGFLVQFSKNTDYSVINSCYFFWNICKHLPIFSIGNRKFNHVT